MTAGSLNIIVKIIINKKIFFGPLTGLRYKRPLYWKGHVPTHAFQFPVSSSFWMRRPLSMAYILCEVVSCPPPPSNLSVRGSWSWEVMSSWTYMRYNFFRVLDFFFILQVLWLCVPLGYRCGTNNRLGYVERFVRANLTCYTHNSFPFIPSL